MLDREMSTPQPQEEHEGAAPSEQLLDSARRNNIDLLETVLSQYESKPAEELTSLINESRDALGNTALHLSAKYGSYEVMDLLLDQPTLEVDPVNRIDGDTPLHLAVRYALAGEPEHGAFMAEVLVEAGADPRVRNNGGAKAVELIKEKDGDEFDTLGEVLQSAEFAFGLEKEDEEKINEGLQGVSLEDGGDDDGDGSASASDEDD